MSSKKTENWMADSQADLAFMMDGAFEILELRVMNVDN